MKRINFQLNETSKSSGLKNIEFCLTFTKSQIALHNCFYLKHHKQNQCFRQSGWFRATGSKEALFQMNYVFWLLWKTTWNFPNGKFCYGHCLRKQDRLFKSEWIPLKTWIIHIMIFPKSLKKQCLVNAEKLRWSFCYNEAETVKHKLRRELRYVLLKYQGAI